MLKLMRKQGSDSDTIMILKERFIVMIKLQLISTFLTPKFRSLKFSDNDEKYDFVSEHGYHIEYVDESDDEVTTSNNHNEEAEEEQDIDKSLYADYYKKTICSNRFR